MHDCLKGKPGGMPARSRHCEGERLIFNHYFIKEMGRDNDQ